MRINGIYLFDEPTPKLLSPPVRAEIKNILSIIKQKRISIHNYHDFIGYTTNYEFMNIEQKNVGGYCDWINKIITTANTDTPIKTLCHEIGHAIQDKLGLFNLKETFSYQVQLEHQAETIAYNLYSALVDKKADYKQFNTYFNIDDIEWLAEYYNGYYENDLKKV